MLQIFVLEWKETDWNFQKLMVYDWTVWYVSDGYVLYKIVTEKVIFICIVLYCIVLYLYKTNTKLIHRHKTNNKNIIMHNFFILLMFLMIKYDLRHG